MSELARLTWRCRRGVRELDLLLQGFLTNEYPRLSPQDKHRFAEMLEAQDPVLLDWFWGRAAPPPELETIVERIRYKSTD